MNIIIEKARPEDAERVLEYLKMVGSETDNLTFGDEVLPISVEEEAAYISQIENSAGSIMLLAKDNGKIVADAGLHRLPRRMSHRADLDISVLKEYWNKGIGSRLLSELIDFAKANSIEIIDLQVRSDNAAAIHLYEKFGFEKIGTHPAYLKMGNEEIPTDYMCLRLLK